MRNKLPNLTDVKILDTVYQLNIKSFYPSFIGVKKILNGVIDEDTNKFINLTTFSTLISIKGRSFTSKIHQLIRYGYLSLKHNPTDDLMYLKITEKGTKFLLDILKEKKLKYKKKNLKENKHEIVFIR